MTEAQTIPAKHIFLDVVGFTHNRSVEAQSDIVHYLNAIVQSSVSAHVQTDDRVIYLPTGDGLCICLLNIETPYDIHMLIAKDIIFSIHNHNNSIGNDMRSFHVRIGINQNTDNLVIDVNGNQNIAGAGINMAARVMTMADDDQILVSESVYDTLRYREKYMSAFRSYVATVKHGVKLPVYQFIEYNFAGLNIDLPKAFYKPSNPTPKFSKVVAYYVAHAVRNRAFLLRTVEDPSFTYMILLWFLSRDSTKRSEASEIRPALYISYKAGESTIDQQYKYYHALDNDVIGELAKIISETYLEPYRNYFEEVLDYRFVKPEGLAKLKQEWPTIWNEFGLEE